MPTARNHRTTTCIACLALIGGASCATRECACPSAHETDAHLVLTPPDDVVLQDPEPMCSVDGWCWQNPRPQGNFLAAVWGSSTTDVFAVGFEGTVLHYDGQGLRVQASGTDRALRGVWGSGPADVFAVGEHGTVIHYDGLTWTVSGSGTSRNLADVWGSSSTDVFAVGESGTILHYDGSSWSPRPSPTSEYLTAIWGTGPNDVFIVGHSGVILHSDGASWQVQESGTSEFLEDIWGSGSRDVYVLGMRNTLFHNDGTRWSPLSPPEGDINAIWGTGPNDVFLFGESIPLLYFDGTTWTERVSLYREPCPDFFQDFGIVRRRFITGAWAADPARVFVVGADGVMGYFEGSSWTSFTQGFRWELEDVCGTSPTNLYAASGHGVLRYDGTSWQVQETGTGAALRAVWVTDVGQVFAVGEEEVYDEGAGFSLERYVLSADRSRWSVHRLREAGHLEDVWASSTDDVFVVDDRGIVYHFNGENWDRRVAEPGAVLRSVWGSGPRDVFAVGHDGVILHFDGESWTRHPSPTPRHLFALWGRAADDVYAVGEEGTILHFDGAVWTPGPTLTRLNLFAVSGSASEVVVAGDWGALLRHDGRRWRREASPAEQRLFGVWMARDGEAFAVGAGGAVLHRDGARHAARIIQGVPGSIPSASEPTR